MLIKNTQKEVLTTDLSLNDFAKAMQAIDLSSIPTEKRKRALMDHLAGIMIDTVHDRSAAVEIAVARVMHAKRS
jgi:hypothetical protein